MADQLLETDPTAMMRQATQAGSDAMATWSDYRRKEFCTTFEARTRAARYILAQTARIVIEKATKSHIAGVQARDEVSPDYRDAIKFRIQHDQEDKNGRRNGVIGGRSTEDLCALAEARADKILEDLPGVRKAMSILQPDVVKMIDARDALKKKGQVLLDRLNEISQPVALSDVDQNMTIGALRKFAKEREKTRRDLVTNLNEVGEEGTALDEQINKKLYKGVPGLHEAVVQVANSHMEKSKMFEEMTRRVQEKVMFGDSAAAQDLLKHFEQDELAISDAVRAELKAAVQKLLGSAPKKAKK
jgi:hypothetical protein